MKSKTTLQWTEQYLKGLQNEEITKDWQTITAVTDLLKFHSTLLQDSAEQRLADLENRVQALQQDFQLGQMGKRK